MAAAVWKPLAKLTTRLSNWFGDEKQLRPSKSLTALNQKSLRINLPTTKPTKSKSSENINRIVSISTPAKKLSKKSSTKDILKFRRKKEATPPENDQGHDANENPVGSFPMSNSWHSHLTDMVQNDSEIAGPSSCIQVGPDGRILTVKEERETSKKPKRSKSITAMNNDRITSDSAALSGPRRACRVLNATKQLIRDSGDSQGNRC
uniref:Protein kinase domain-containing protein n=1 Tax=Panagrolaimus sp. JU765 TaxID=591449 RepID=A0AC34RST0_9BILA